MVEVRMELSKSFDTLGKRFEEVTKQGEDAFYRTIDFLADAILEYAKEFAPVNTGEMREAITYHARKTVDGYVAVVEAGKGLMFVEFGTGLYASPRGGGTRAKRIPWFIPARALTPQKYNDLKFKYEFPIWTNSSGEEFFMCYGQAPQPFMYPAVIAGAGDFNRNASAWFRLAFIDVSSGGTG